MHSEYQESMNPVKDSRIRNHLRDIVHSLTFLNVVNNTTVKCKCVWLRNKNCRKYHWNTRTMHLEKAKIRQKLSKL